MPRKSSHVPPLKFHAPTGQHCVYYRGDRHYMGADPEEAEKRHEVRVEELKRKNAPKPIPKTDAPEKTVAEVLVAEHAASSEGLFQCWSGHHFQPGERPLSRLHLPTCSPSRTPGR